MRIITFLQVLCAALLQSHAGHGRNHGHGHNHTHSHANITTNYTLHARAAVRTLHQWYDPSTGLWANTWWNSANVLTMLVDFAMIDNHTQDLARETANNTFVQAQKDNIYWQKAASHDTGIVDSQYNHQAVNGVYPEGFINDYYDDQGWWALAWVRAFDMIKEARYLEAAIDIFEDMTLGWTTPCGGGVWWDKAKTGIASISNELFLSVAAHLANRVEHVKDLTITTEDSGPRNSSGLRTKKYYLDWAHREWNWFAHSGVINKQNLVNDGINLHTCRNEHPPIWTYNQGVILGALIELNKASPNSTYISQAHKIATAAIKHFGKDGVLREIICEPHCGGDGSQFKGIFMRNLMLLQEAAPQAEYKRFIKSNADSIWKHDRNVKTNALDLCWAGPFNHEANATTHSSAMDALVAAAALGSKNSTVGGNHTLEHTTRSSTCVDTAHPTTVHHT
ncbi:MAG: hypothetical protein M1828_003829 [Chrysothrix sp. TS-e1954]|nr:MAG: hypothetical protein M1828_003829 [Chrysothrix sp. TS-e1954]